MWFSMTFKKSYPPSKDNLPTNVEGGGCTPT